jgi:hypothetical protein
MDAEQGDFPTIGNFVGYDKVAYEQAVLHRGRRDLVRFDNGCPDQEEHHDQESDLFERPALRPIFVYVRHRRLSTVQISGYAVLNGYTNDNAAGFTAATAGTRPDAVSG